MHDILLYMLVGFLAQIVDGCLGMAYGVISSTFLITIGIPVANASASVHFAEIFTSLSAGISHFKFKNVDKKILYKLIIPGVIGGIIGAYVLTSFNAEIIKPFISFYLLTLGIYIFFKGLQRIRIRRVTNNIAPLGFIGGLLDAMGGGGWGPIVTTTLVTRGNSPRRSVGTVNTAEFFVTIAQSMAFIFCLGNYSQYFKIIIGLLLGGMIAAPIAAYACKKINVKIMTILIGVIIITTNIFALLKYFKIINIG